MQLGLIFCLRGGNGQKMNNNIYNCSSNLKKKKPTICWNVKACSYGTGSHAHNMLSGKS